MTLHAVDAAKMGSVYSDDVPREAERNFRPRHSTRRRYKQIVDDQALHQQVGRLFSEPRKRTHVLLHTTKTPHRDYRRPMQGFP